MIDPKKALAARDGDDSEEVGGELQLVHLAAAPGTTPDQLAGTLQVSQLRGELALLVFPLFVLFQPPVRGALQTAIIFYFGLLWPALGLSLAWAPLQSVRRRLPLQDTLFVGFAYAQALLTGAMVATPVTMILTRLIRTMTGTGNQYASLLAFWPSLLLGAFVACRSLARSLVERNLEDLAIEDVPRHEELQDARRELTAWNGLRSALGTSFRAAGMMILATLPFWLLGEYHWIPRPQGSFLLASWWLTFAGLGLHQLARGGFYLAMSRRTVAALEERRLRLDALIEQTGTNELPAALPPQPADLAWSNLRAPRSAARVLFFSGVYGAAATYLSVFRISPAGASLAAVGLAGVGALGLRGQNRNWVQRLPAALVAAIPAAVAAVALGYVWEALPRGGWGYRALYQSLTIFTMVFVGDRAAAAWAYGFARLRGVATRLPPVDLDVTRRAATLVAFAFLTMAGATDSVRAVFGWQAREFFQTFIMASASFGAMMVAMRSHSAAITDGASERELPGDLPVSASLPLEAAAAQEADQPFSSVPPKRTSA